MKQLSDADLERLNQLASMRDKGILTDDELAEQKRRPISLFYLELSDIDYKAALARGSSLAIAGRGA